LSISNKWDPLDERYDDSPMLNAYPDSIGGSLKAMAEFFSKPELDGVFKCLYILPSLFNTDLDRGFSVIDYELNEMLASSADLEKLKEFGLSFKFDFILNHASVLSKQFQDIIKNGENSKYKDFFINWNKFWDGKGELTTDGYIQPNEVLIREMHLRKPGLPILMVRMPDGTEIPYWNTFYQEVRYRKVSPEDLVIAAGMQYSAAAFLACIINESLDAKIMPKNMDFGKLDQYRDIVIEFLETGRRYLGQMDLNINSPLVWDFYDETLGKLKGYGAEIVRLDAFAYAPKEPGKKNFLNDPGTFELLEKVRSLSDRHGVELLPEIHSRYEEGVHDRLSEKGYLTYDFFLPGLIIDAFERSTNEKLVKWIKDIVKNKIRTVNMLGCHDGIPLLDLKGLLSEEQIEHLVEIVVNRGGHVKNLHGRKNLYYQVNSTYFSALGEDADRLLLARAIQMFMPGKPQIWYLDLFVGRNNHEAVEKAGSGGHKEINRTNLTVEQVEEGLKNEVVTKQLDLIRFRNTCQAFGHGARLTVFDSEQNILKLQWENNGWKATLEADLKTYRYNIVTEAAEAD